MLPSINTNRDLPYYVKKWLPGLNPKQMQGLALVLWLLGWALRLWAVLSLPFVALVRGAVWAYWEVGVWGYVALLFGVALSFLVVWAYFLLAFIWMYGREALLPRQIRVKAWAAGLLVGFFCLYSLFFISRIHAKDDKVHAAYLQLHPVLRLGVGTMVFFDEEAVVTETARSQKAKRSLHQVQADGYVHAIDLRTRDRSWVRNKLLQFYFWLMGFRTLRHGPADHLHVSLPIHERPEAY